MPFPVSAQRIIESGLTQENIDKWEARELRWGNHVAKLLWGGAAFYRVQQMNVAQRTRLAAEMLASKVKINLSIPVLKIPRLRTHDTTQEWMGKPVGNAGTPGTHGGPIGSQYTYVPPESRSKPGEFPRADTTTLLKSIFVEGPEWTSPTTVECRVGMPLDYGLRLELQLDRSFLVRTLNEEWDQMAQVLAPPGGQP